MLDLLAQCAAGLKARKAPPDHGDHANKAPAGEIIHTLGQHHVRGKVDVGYHHQRPDNGNAPEEEHESILEAACHFCAADVSDDEKDNRNGCEQYIADWQFHAEGLEQHFEVERKCQRLTGGDGDERCDKVPARQHTGGLSKSELRIFVRAACEREGCAHLRIKVSGIYADDHGHKGCEDDGGTHRADNLRAGCEQADADNSADRNGNGFAHTKRAFQRFILGCAHKDILLAIKFSLCGDRS